MSKSTLKSLENLLAQFITPIDQKLETVMKELVRLEEKIDKLEADKHLSSNVEGSSRSVPAISLTKPTTSNTHTADREKRTSQVKRPTHTSTTPTVVAKQPRAPPPQQSAPAPRANALVPAPPVSQRPAAPVVTPLRRPPPARPLAPAFSRSYANKPQQNDDDDEWNVVSYKTKRPQRRREVITGKGSVENDLLTVERVRKIHACFFKPDTTPESIVAFMNRKSPNNKYDVVKLKLTHNYYSSFAITVPCSQFIFFTTAENWPHGTEISEWFRYSDGRARGTSTQATRRKHSFGAAGHQNSPSATSPRAAPTTAPAAAQGGLASSSR